MPKKGDASRQRKLDERAGCERIATMRSVHDGKVSRFARGSGLVREFEVKPEVIRYPRATIPDRVRVLDKKLELLMERVGS